MLVADPPRRASSVATAHQSGWRGCPCMQLGGSHASEKRFAETDCVADDAVRCQPVSGIEFPGNREINREFCKFGPFLAILAPNRRANSMDCSKNSLCTGTGNFLEDYRENRVFL